MRASLTFLLLALAGATGNRGLAAELRPCPLFADRMVLQQERRVPVWGQARPGSTVTVAFAGQSVSTQADAQGRWLAWLAPLKAESQGAALSLQADGTTLTLRDVLVGEVWLCSGQSNMDFNLTGLTKGSPPDSPLLQAMAAADDPQLRQFEVEKTPAPEGPAASLPGPGQALTGRWIVGTPRLAGAFSGVGFFFGRELRSRLGVPVGLLKAAWGNTPIEAWMSREALAATAAGQANLGQWESRSPRQGPAFPATLYNGMIRPLAPFALRGVIWYQGESNVGQPAYGELFPALIADWRRTWEQGDFPFYYVQLAGYLAVAEQPGDSLWARLRDAQLRALRLPATGMAVTIDSGDEKSVHPRNKIAVGQRLALWALAKDYGQALPACSGPLLESATFADGKARLHFREVGSGLAAGRRPDLWAAPELTDAAPERFQIAAADRRWVWAQARITGKDSVEVWADEVHAPVAVRYAWMNNPGPALLLYNREGLPASPFRTDDF